jgi:pyruvate,orthophosphate dikinase
VTEEALGALPAAGYARLVNADPMTGVPAVLGEVAETLAGLDAHRPPPRVIIGLPLDRRVQGAAAGVAARCAPTVLVVRLDEEGWEVVRDERLDLAPEALLRFLHARWEDGRLGDDAFLRAVPTDVLELARPRIDWRRSAALVPLTKGLPICGVPRKGVLAPADPHPPAAERGPYLALVDRVDARHTVLLDDPRCSGMLALRGSRADHFALLAQERGLGYLILEGHRLDARGLGIGTQVVPFGTLLTIDFYSGEVYAGDGVIAAQGEEPKVRTVRALLAARSSPIPLRLNVDAADDLGEAFPLEASGVGLLRTEHLLRRGRQEEPLRRLLIPDGERADPGVCEQLRAFFAHEFARLLRLAQGRPVTVRLLDFPLHELRSPDLGIRAGEVNPMLGLRGVRQGVRWPHLYRLQIEALLMAGAAVTASGTRIAPLELCVPLVTLVEEVELVRRWVEQAREATAGCAGIPVVLGAMVETPAAVLAAGDIARRCNFLSFGTNDLTQLVLGLSREDYLPVLRSYQRHGLLRHDPFAALDPVVVRAIEMAARHAREANPGVVLGLCGAHAEDPSTLALHAAGLLDYLSVSLTRLSHAKLRALAASPVEVAG